MRTYIYILYMYITYIHIYTYIQIYRYTDIHLLYCMLVVRIIITRCRASRSGAAT